MRGQLLYPDFKDPLAVTSLEIVEYDEDAATVLPVRGGPGRGEGQDPLVDPLARQLSGRRQGPGGRGGPALMGLKILEVASDPAAINASTASSTPTRRSSRSAPPASASGS